METFGICLLSQVPMRATISHASEMVSQLLFGDTFIILEKYTHWFKIRTDADGYEAWVDSKQVKLIPKELHQIWNTDAKAAFTTQPHSLLSRTGDLSRFSVGMGCRLPLWEQGLFAMPETGFETAADLLTADARKAMAATEKREALLKSAAQWLYTPYLWGGKSIFGTDCSGFTQTLCRMYGVQLPRDAKDQAMTGETVNFIEEALPGDLLFFDSETNQMVSEENTANPTEELPPIVHVGLYMGHQRIIHASGLVRIDTVDHQGIYRPDTKAYTHRLRLINRVFA